MEYQDFDFRQSSDDTPIGVSAPLDEPPAWPKLVAAGVLVVAVALTGYLVFRNRGVSAPANTPATTAAPAPTDAFPTRCRCGPDRSAASRSIRRCRARAGEGALVKPRSRGVASTDNLIRNFTVVVTNVASGEAAAGRVRL